LIPQVSVLNISIVGHLNGQTLTRGHTDTGEMHTSPKKTSFSGQDPKILHLETNRDFTIVFDEILHTYPGQKKNRNPNVWVGVSKFTFRKVDEKCFKFCTLGLCCPVFMRSTSSSTFLQAQSCNLSPLYHDTWPATQKLLDRHANTHTHTHTHTHTRSFFEFIHASWNFNDWKYDTITYRTLWSLRSICPAWIN
jgi:hypothetical protein